MGHKLFRAGDLLAREGEAEFLMPPSAKHIKLAAGSANTEDVLIVGAGLAGLFLALQLRPRSCLIVSPSPIGTAASSAWAQGGLAAALDPEDSPEAHAADTVDAGAGLVDPVVARLIAEEGAERVSDLIALGVPFDKTENGALALSLEAAHSRPRVARVAGDLAGKAIMDALVAATEVSPSISLIETAKAVALLQDENGKVGGALLQSNSGDLIPCRARHTVLCTGGSGGLFRVTTNPVSARGEAIALAYQAGGLIADPEFVQFHPTALDVDRDPAPLATEALRGEGAFLVNSKGERFMERYHELAELAPRDEVARAIHFERAAGRGAFLDARTAVGAAFPDHFPTVYSACLSSGIDPITDLMPVAPAAHYHMGGIVSDLWGQSSLDGLSVCGECASTGAHGANRLASNSLLEAVVFAHRIGERLSHQTLSDPGDVTATAPPVLPDKTISDLRRHMADHCGVVRDAEGLSILSEFIAQTMDTVGPASPLVTASLMARAAAEREESRGGHFRSDFPSAGVPMRSYLSISAKQDALEHV
ncbi:MAG: L-aspartate oxidase [Pseudomonadota bacterium]